MLKVKLYYLKGDMEKIKSLIELDTNAERLLTEIFIFKTSNFTFALAKDYYRISQILLEGGHTVQVKEGDYMINRIRENNFNGLKEIEILFSEESLLNFL